jgi:hypothetical protein
MIKYLILNLLLCTVCFPGNFVIEDFSASPECVWSPCKWGGRKNASYKITSGILTLNFGEMSQTGKNDFSFYAKLKQKCNLKNYKYLSFKARSVGSDVCTIFVYLKREMPQGKDSSFYSIVRLTPEWKNYNLELRSAARSQASKGLFVKTKSDAGASRQLDTGGLLKSLNFYTKTAKVIEIDKIELKSNIDKNQEENSAIAKAIEKHKKFSPYKFKKIIRADGPALVEDGKSSFVIHVEASTGETGKFAAAQLADYIKKATGAALTITDKFPAKQNVIRLSVIPDANPPEGFKTEALKANEILICGNNQRGLLYGVYDFLEKALDIRWFAPFDYAEVIPKKKNVKLPLWTDESFPHMIYRRFHYCSMGRGIPDPMKHRYTVADWCVKNRYNVELERLVSKHDKPAVKEKRLNNIKQFYSKRGGYIALPTMWGHNYHYWVSPEEYLKTNPEYFCLDSSTGKWRAERAQLCATNPEVVKVIVQKAVEYFKKYPEREYFPLFQEDGSRLWCQCPGCTALYKGSDINSYKTEHNINLANNVAEELNKIIHGKKIATYAYSVTNQPPVNVKPRGDVFVTYCLMDFSKPEKFPWQGYSGEELAAWSKLCNGNLILYTYNYLDFFYTANTASSLVRLFRYFDLMKIKCSCQESNENWYGVSAYNYYLSSRLAWDPWFDAEEFRKDYYDKLYGDAGEYIEKYHAILESCLSNKKYWLEYGNRTFPYIPQDKLKAIEACLEKANTVTKNDERTSKAVKAQNEGFRYVKAFSEAVVTGSEFQKTLDEAKYNQVMKSLSKLEKIIKELAPNRLVTLVALRQTQGMRRNMRENYTQNSKFKALTDKYKIISEIPVMWSFKTDPNNEGEKDQWFAKDINDSKWNKIKIGDWWSNQGFKNYLGTAWYRTKLKVPEHSKNLALYFNGVDERAWIYLDGKYIGGHNEGDVKKLWNDPFLIKLPKGIDSATHQLTVKVHASAGKGGIWKSVFLMAEK